MSIDSTQFYIDKFNYSNNKLTLPKLMHDHPTVVKILQVSGTVFAILAIVAAIAFPPVTIAASIAGSIALAAVACSWLFLKYGTCAKHDMKNHAFEEAVYGEGRLYYRGDIPILELGGDNPRLWGEAHGRLLGSHIDQLRKHFDLVLKPVLPPAKQLSHVISGLKKEIPAEYLNELEGLADGYNQWAQAEKINDRMSVEDLIRMHLVPDSKHFHLKEAEKELRKGLNLLSTIQQSVSPACTSILYKDSRLGMIFARNMDWMPFGNGGTKSLVIVWKNKQTAVLGVPGLIGAVTGWNQNNLCLAMNVCPGTTEEIRGMPAIFYNRMLLEKANTVDDVSAIAKVCKPLGAYHVTVADAKGNGKCISFYNDIKPDCSLEAMPEAIQEEDYSREAKPDQVLTVLNWRYPEMNGGYFNSATRDQILNRYFSDGAGLDSHRLVANALKMHPYVNSWITMHSMIFKPETGKLSLSMDNGFAPSNEYQEANIADFFQCN